MKRLLLLATLCVACETNQESVQDIHYVRDERTGLCFAAWGLGLQHGLLAGVPCTPEVLELVKSGK